MDQGKIRIRTQIQERILPFPSREGVGGRGLRGSPDPLPPPPSREGRGSSCSFGSSGSPGPLRSSLAFVSVLPSLLFLLAALTAALDYAFPPDLSRLRATGT